MSFSTYQLILLFAPDHLSIDGLTVKLHLSSTLTLANLNLERLYFHRYFFPTYENDNLLCALEDEDDEEENDDEDDTSPVAPRIRKRTTSSEVDLVIAEDLPFKDSVLKNPDLLEELRT